MADLPDDVRTTAERLTRRARRAAPEAAAAHRARRDELLADHGYAARVREEDGDEVLVLYPLDWFEDGRVRPDRIGDLDRAVEIRLTGVGDPDDWDAVARHNREVAARVRERHGDVHGDNAAAFADFMSNHYAKPIEDATPEEVAVFLKEYFPRNAWPTDDQRTAVDESVERLVELARADEEGRPT
jgi:hypothetical protein